MAIVLTVTTAKSRQQKREGKMIYRIENDDLGQHASQGFRWFPSERAALAELKKEWQDSKLEGAEWDEAIYHGGWELYKELNFRSFPTPKGKKELLDFLSTWASYPDNG
jgi:hypothetical protein